MARPLGSALLAGLTLALLAACAPAPPKPAPAGPSASDVAFEALAARYLDEAAALYPVRATLRGDHRHDGELDDLGAGGRERRAAFVARYLGELGALDRTGMSPASRVDLRRLATELDEERWRLTELDEWRSNPLRYTELSGDALYPLLVRDVVPLPERLRALAARLDALPRLLADERDALDPARVPRIHAETAARQNAGVLALITDEIAPQATVLDGDERSRFEQAVERARTAVRQHQTWLSKRLVSGARGDFQLGAARFDRALRYALDAAGSRNDVRAAAEAALVRTRSDMYAAAREVLRNRPSTATLPDSPTPPEQQVAISTALALAAADHPPREAALAAATQAIAAARQFVKDHALVTLYEEPLEARALPAYRRGTTTQACDAPGSAERGAASYYLIAPLPPSVSGPQVAYYLREHNRRAVQEDAIRFAVPGRCLQAAHSARYGGASARAALRGSLPSADFVDGWEVYAGLMMAEEGAAGGDPLRRLVQLKAYLREIVHTILDQAVHVDGLSRDAALRSLAYDAFEERNEAADDWTRVQLSEGRLAAGFVGAAAHLALREEAKRRWGANFTLRHYHDAVLSFGAVPLRDVRALLFGLAVEE